MLGKVIVKGGKILPMWFDLSTFKEGVSLTGDTTTFLVDNDKNIRRETSSTSGEEATIIAIPLYFSGNGAVHFSYDSSNPSKISVSDSGKVRMVSPEETASAIIAVTATQGELTLTREVSVTLTLSGASTFDFIESAVAGSARAAMTDHVDNNLSGADTSTDQNIYNSQNHSSGVYERNPNIFLNGYTSALTCASPWNSQDGARRAGTAITPRHIIFANHYALNVGTTLRFITSDNSVIERTIVGVTGDITSSNISELTDVAVGVLDSDLPTSITPCKIFPANHELYLPQGEWVGSWPAHRVPAVVLDQQEKLLVYDIGRFVDTTAYYRQYHGYLPTSEDRLAFHEQLVVGDSGNPVFAAIGSELWLVSTNYWVTPWRAGGAFYGDLVADINSAITTLDTLQNDITGYTVTVGDLSSYPTY